MTPFFKVFIKVAAVAALLCSANSASAQNRVLEQLTKLKDVEYSYLSSATLYKAEDLPQMSSSVEEILPQLNSIEILTSDDKTSYRKIVEDIRSLSDPMTLISKIQADNEMTQIFGKKSKAGNDERSQRSYSEILFINDDRDAEEVTVILFTGNIKPESIKDMIE